MRTALTLAVLVLVPTAIACSKDTPSTTTTAPSTPSVTAASANATPSASASASSSPSAAASASASSARRADAGSCGFVVICKPAVGEPPMAHAPEPFQLCIASVPEDLRGPDPHHEGPFDVDATKARRAKTPNTCCYKAPRALCGG